MALKGLFGSKKEEAQPIIPPTGELNVEAIPDNLALSEEQRDNMQADLDVINDQDGEHEQRLQKEAVKEVQEQAQESIIQLQKIKLGRCPKCGAHLVQRASANICEECGWNKYDVPKYGKIIVHLKNNDGTVEGDHAYVLKDGYCLLTRGDVIFAKIPRESYSWVEYSWTEDELDQRKRAMNASIKINCGWCNQEADVNKDGFHLVHIAFGSSQERYCFCSDDCYEAFRKMYPSRVHRNCYETNCNDCNLCLKRYGDEAESIRILAKDQIRMTK